MKNSRARSHTSCVTIPVGEIARQYGVSFATVARWIDLGYLRGFKPPYGVHRKVLLIDYQAFIRKHPIPLEMQETA